MRFAWKWMTLATVGAIVAGPSGAAERELGAHLHGHGSLNLVIEDNAVWAELEAPGADIVGFEHAAETAADQAAIAEAEARLAKPATVILLPEAAGCLPDEVSVTLESEAEEAQHAHDEEHHDQAEEAQHAHDEGHHDQAEETQHAHDEEHHDQAEETQHAHDEEHHDQAEETQHAHDEEHHDQAEGGTHSEFHVRYKLTCSDATQIDAITFSYFDSFAGAEELRVTLIDASGQAVYEVERGEARIRLGGS